ncbi:syntaxin-17 isoform X2 [Patella vulgata]|nr:syntaxin-17 isoform X2 [Patella vulgata]
MTSLERQSSYGAARSVKKFGNLTEMNLELLNCHRNNIERLSIQEKWTLLNKEQINATSTVQQVKVNIIELEKVRGLINHDDLHKFDAHIDEVKLKAMQTVEDFILLGRSRSSSPTEVPVATESSSSSSNQHGIPHTPAYNIHRPNDSSDALTPTMTDPHPASINPETSASWERLQEALVDLFSTIHQYSPIVQEREEKVDTIEEDKIETAHTGVQHGTSSLGQTNKYKAAIFPVAGAVIGGVLGGPLGFIAGLKLGGAAAVSGGVVGYVGGQYLQQKQDEEAGVELNNLNVTRHKPLEDISSTTVQNTS